MSNNNKLFSKHNLKGADLENRVVMAPMTRSRAVDQNKANALMATYYEQRSEAGLIITEGTSPSVNGLGYPRIPGLFNEAQSESWQQVTDAVHKAGSKIFVQLMHTGRISHVKNLPVGGEVLAPSAITAAAPFNQMYVDGEGMLELTQPRAMTTEEVKAAVNEYVESAKLAVKAGFDGVEIHGANGYLINQFINPKSNQRNDEYGGSIEGRARFVVEIAEGMATAIGAEKVGLRISPFGIFNDMGAFEGIDEQYEYIAKEMSRIGIAYIHLADMSAMTKVPVPDSIKRSLRAKFEGTFVLNGAYDKDRAEQDLEAGHGDLIAFGIPWIANPDLVTRMKEGTALSAPDQSTFYTPGEQGYTDYPRA